ncbi:hypothetical protein [Maricaulis sp.]|uniref:hypothetical protein n=1 Tax=Maricaulis sp. TaxID=1486257 RepID=UPI003A8F4F96
MELFKRIREHEQLKRRLQRLRTLATAGMLTAIGAALTVAPLPFGAPILAGGLALLSAVDRSFRRALMRARERSKLLNSILGRAGGVLPAPVRKLIGLTDPLTYHREAGPDDPEKP